jgi:hypothetical protein
MHAMHAHIRARIQTHLRVRICVLPSACACRYAYLYSRAHCIHVACIALRRTQVGCTSLAPALHAGKGVSIVCQICMASTTSGLLGIFSLCAMCAMRVICVMCVMCAMCLCGGISRTPHTSNTVLLLRKRIRTQYRAGCSRPPASHSGHAHHVRGCVQVLAMCCTQGCSGLIGATHA